MPKNPDDNYADLFDDEEEPEEEQQEEEEEEEEPLIEEGFEEDRKEILDGLRSGKDKLGPSELRFMVDGFYRAQDYRKIAGNQIKALIRAGKHKEEISPSVGRIWSDMRKSEGLVRAMMDAWADHDPTSSRVKQVVGIGPIIAAGLSAHISVKIATNPSKVMRFAGLDPSMKWHGATRALGMVKEIKKTVKKAEAAIEPLSHSTGFSVATLRRFTLDYGGDKYTWNGLAKAAARCPWNARLKLLCWKIGDSFVKNSNRGSYFGGVVYRQAKERYAAKNEAGDYAGQAEETLDAKAIKDKKTRAFYEAGRLPPGRVEQRARRIAVKKFLTCWWLEEYRNVFKKEPPDPYPIAILGHADLVTLDTALEWEAAWRKKNKKGSTSKAK